MDLIIVNEIWRSIDGYLNYQVSNTGYVRNANNGELVQQRKRSGYWIVHVRTDVKRTTCSVHRLVAKSFIANPDNKSQVDHINNNKDNNCMNNLRQATHQENQRTKQKTLRPTTSNFVGVCWNKYHQQWQAKISINKKRIHIGYFDDPKDAARAYNERVTAMATEFGDLNEI